jgi:lipopolysaccharide export system protein LptC
MIIRVVAIVLLIINLLVVAKTWAAEGKKQKNVVIRKTQSVDFEGDTVDGIARSPDGVYLVQKRSIDFVPLYKVRGKFDENIRSSIEYVK